MLEINVRTMTETDLHVVSELALLANPHEIKERYTNHILAEMQTRPELSLVAVVDRKVIGYVQANLREDGSARLEDIAVDKEHQGKGVGDQLPTAELNKLRDMGAKSVLADVHYKCSSAIPFYYRHGFRISGSSQDYFGLGHDVVILLLQLQK
jgi:ribosomal protein S18 acetylase RimI-like enzyme